MTSSVVRGSQAVESLMWITWGNTDYRATRLLLLNDMVVQGTVLANTAVEKYLKAVFAHADLPVPHLHHVDKLYERIQKNTKLDLSLNISFLEHLRKAYKLRYFDDLPDGFNIVLSQAKILAQLDRLVFAITSRFKMAFKGRGVPMVLEVAKTDSDQNILAKNVAIDPGKTNELFSLRSGYLELRRHKGSTLEARYEMQNIADDLVFNQVGLAPKAALVST